LGAFPVFIFFVFGLATSPSADPIRG
jgi:hypothetical protein